MCWGVTRAPYKGEVQELFISNSVAGTNSPTQTVGQCKHTVFLSREPVAKRISLKLFQIVFCLFLWIVEIYEQKDMLASIGVTQPPTTTTRSRQRRGAESYRHSHKKGHKYRQQKNSNYNKTPSPPTLTTMHQIRDKNNNDSIPKTTTITGCRWQQWQKLIKY